MADINKVQRGPDAAQKVEWYDGGDGHGYRYQYIGPIHYLCECGDYFLNRQRWLVHKREGGS